MTNLSSEEISSLISDIDSEINRIKDKPTMSHKVVELRGKKKKLQQALSKAVAEEQESLLYSTNISDMIAPHKQAEEYKMTTFQSNDVEFAQRVLTKYKNKVQNAKERGIEFSLSLTSFINLMKAKKCQYSGVTLTEPEFGNPSPTDRTIDRIDPNKGYVKGNVVVCCHAANQLKSFCEKGGEKGMKLGIKILSNANKRMKKVV